MCSRSDSRNSEGLGESTAGGEAQAWVIVKRVA
jgi:hypothetical protein